MKSYILCFAILVMLASGCARPRLVADPNSPYESLGVLELKLPTKRKIAPYLTAGLMRRHSSRSLEKRLNKELWKQAKKFHNADAVTNVTYWPSPQQDAWVDFYYVRGEMIRYKPFAEPVEIAPAANVNPQ